MKKSYTCSIFAKQLLGLVVLCTPSLLFAANFSVNDVRHYPVVPIHFAIITDHYESTSGPTAHDYNDRNTLKHFVKILNERFLTRNGNQMVLFKLKSVTSFSDAQATTSLACRKVVRTGQGMVNLRGADFGKDADGNDITFPDLVDGCLDSKQNDSRIADPKAINVYIYDSWSTGTTAEKDIDSSGNFNLGRPVIRIDYARVFRSGVWDVGAVFEHEMGHGFYLSHVCNDEDADGNGKPDGDRNTSTNIMSSANSWPVTVPCNPDTVYGGNRRLGFEHDQIEVIRRSIDQMSFIQ